MLVHNDLRKRKSELLKTLKDIPIVQRCIPTYILIEIILDVLYLEEMDSIEDFINVKSKEFEQSIVNIECQQTKMFIIMEKIRSRLDNIVEVPSKIGEHGNRIIPIDLDIYHLNSYWNDYLRTVKLIKVGIEDYILNMKSLYYTKKEEMRNNRKMRGILKRRLREEIHNFYFGERIDGRMNVANSRMKAAMNSTAAGILYYEMGVFDWNNKWYGLS